MQLGNQHLMHGARAIAVSTVGAFAYAVDTRNPYSRIGIPLRMDIDSARVGRDGCLDQPIAHGLDGSCHA